MLCTDFYVHFKYILLEHHQPEMCSIHFKIFGYCSDWYCWHSLKKAHFSLLAISTAIDSTLGQIQNLSKQWIIYLLAQLIACSLSPFLHQFICRLFFKFDKWSSFSRSSTKRWPNWGLVIPRHLERASSKPTPQSLQSQSVSIHQRQKQRQREKAPGFSLANLFMEAEEKPKGQKQQRHKVLNLAMESRGNHCSPTAWGKAVSRTSDIWAG